MKPGQIRKIIHVDMDAFFASIEQRDCPEYRGKPLAVGGRQKRGVIAAASYEARKYGVYSAMPSAIAVRKCPHLIFARARFDAYKAASDQIMHIFKQYTDIVEPVSIDEAFLDVTQNYLNNPSASLLAKDIKEQIWKETGLTASAGVSFNKFLAKVASDFDKPNGLTVITPKQAMTFIAELPIKKIPGIGKVTEAKMHQLDIRSGSDLQNIGLEFLIYHFGKIGSHFHRLVHCKSSNKVVVEYERKSVGTESTFTEDSMDEDTLLASLADIVQRLVKRLDKKDLSGKTVTLKIKYFDFIQQTRSRTLDHFVDLENELYPLCVALFYTPFKPLKKVRLLGVSLGNLSTYQNETGNSQLSLPFNYNKKC